MQEWLATVPLKCNVAIAHQYFSWTSIYDALLSISTCINFLRVEQGVEDSIGWTHAAITRASFHLATRVINSSSLLQLDNSLKLVLWYKDFIMNISGVIKQDKQYTSLYAFLYGN